MSQAQLPKASYRFAVGLIVFAVTYPLVAAMVFAQSEDRLHGKGTAVALKTMSGPNDVVLTDQPWTVAWYGDRRAIWVPNSIKATQRIRDNVKELRWLFMTPTIAGFSSEWQQIYGALLGWNKNWNLATRQKLPVPAPALITMEQVPEGMLTFMKPLDGFATVPPVDKHVETVLAKLQDNPNKTAAN